MEAYLHLLRQQIEKNRLINELARRGRDAISTGDIVPIIEGNALRKQIMLQIQSLQSEMENCLTTPPDEWDQLSSPLKDELRTAQIELHSLVSETLAIDEQNQSRIREIRAVVGDKLEDIGRGRKALSGYRFPVRKKPRLIDGQG